MNIAGQLDSDLLFVNFNQDFSCLSVGTRHGYKIYNTEPFGKCLGKQEGGMGIVEMLFCTSLVALVGAGEQSAFSPRRLQITNTKRNSVICELTFPTSILAVKMNRRRLVVVLEEQIYVYDISNMKLIHTIDTSPNPNAVMALAPSSENCFLAYPSPTPSPLSPFSAGSPGTASYNVGRPRSTNTGDVLIFDALALQVLNIVQAHKAPVAHVAVNADGTLMATASEKGTVVRVHSIPDARKLYQFRRGSYPARVYCITFNLVSSLLCVSSDQETVHIFRLLAPGAVAAGGSGPRGSANDLPPVAYESNSSKQDNKASYGKVLKKSVAGYLPDVLTEMWEPARDFASLKIKGSTSGFKSIVAVSSTTPQVMVVTSEGYFYQYNIDLENGGECSLLKQYCLTEPNEDTVPNMLGD